MVSECPYYLISRASLAVTSLLKRELTAAGLEGVRPAYLGVLMTLWQEDGLKSRELGRRVCLEPSTMTGLIDRMERQGLVSRVPDPLDRRASRITLTDAGREIKERAEQVVDAALAQGLEGLSEHDLEQMKTCLRRVLENAERLSER